MIGIAEGGDILLASVHIVYPESGINFSELKKIFATFEEGCKLFNDKNFNFEEGKVVKLESGSIFLQVVLPIVTNVFPLFVDFVTKKLMNRRGKNKLHVEIDSDGKITIMIKE